MGNGDVIFGGVNERPNIWDTSLRIPLLNPLAGNSPG